MTPLLNAIAVIVAVLMSAAVYVKGPTIEQKWERIIAELSR